MSALPSFRLKAGFDQSYAASGELEGIVWYEVFKCDSRYDTSVEPASIRPQRMVKVKFVPPSSPQDDVRNFFGCPETGATEGQHSRWTIWIRRKVNGVTVDVSYNMEVMDTTLHSEVVTGVEQQYYLITFAMLKTDLVASINRKA